LSGYIKSKLAKIGLKSENYSYFAIIKAIKKMTIIADKRIPETAKIKLTAYGRLILLETKGITYDAISGHPDIFFCKINDQLIIAPNLHESYKKELLDLNIPIIEGEENVGNKYPESAKYNVVTTNKFLMHNFRYTDSAITNHSDDLDLIHLNQGYSRCNLLPLKNNGFITSDEGIKRVLLNYKLNVLYVNPEDIQLPGFKHGFFGGACGVMGNSIFILGSLNKFKDGEKVKAFCQSLNYEIIELFDGPLLDAGSILFI
jgi:hypothetical protein